MPPLGTTTEPVNEAGGHAQLGYRFSFEWWRLTLSAGAAAGGGVLAQLYGARAATAIFVASPHLGLRLRLSSAISLGLDADFPIIGLNVRTNTGEGVAWYGFAVGSANVVVSL